METNQYPQLFQCVGCESQLKKSCKTLPCLHSVCNLCFHNTLEDEETEGKCPECGDAFQNDNRLTLSPILNNELNRQQLSLPEWQCYTCMEDDISSGAKHWCVQCEKLLCTNCLRFHNKLIVGHISKDLAEMNSVDAIDTIMGKKCLLHGKAVELFCESCNTCYCNTCYNYHSTELIRNLNCMNVSPVLVKDEALKIKDQVPNLEKEMTEFKEFLQSSNVNFSKYTDELNFEYDAKCKDVWMKYEEMVENARLAALDLCEKMGQETAEEVKKWRHIFDENTRILKEVEIWLVNLRHLIREDHHEREMLCGLKLLTSRLPSRHHKWMQLTEKCEFSYILPDWWNQAMEPLVNRETLSVSCVQKPVAVQNLVKENEWIVPGLKSRFIRTILISENDNHIFLCDSENKSIIEMSENGQFVSEFLLSDKENKNFAPVDMCFISPEQLVVCASGENKLIFLKRIKKEPFLQIQKIVPTKTGLRSLCLKNGTIFACDNYLAIHSFTMEGIEIKTKDEGVGFSKYYPRIRVDFISGKLWSSSLDRSEMICFNSEGEKIDSFKKENYYVEFSLTEFGQFYCNSDGIFSFFTNKLLYTFPQDSNSTQSELLFVCKKKLFLCLETDRKWRIEILKIFY